MGLDIKWDAIDWLLDARQLLDWLHHLDTGPSLLLIRHSERLQNLPVLETIKAELTPAGHEIAREFGRRLPQGKTIRLFHSSVTRAKQTAERIHDGAAEVNEDVQMEGVSDALSGAKGDLERFVEMVSETSFSEFFNRWMDNNIPEEVLEPPAQFISRLAPSTLGLLRTADGDEIHIHVSHDLVVACAKNHLLQLECKQELEIPFLGGFGVVNLDGTLSGFTDDCEAKIIW